MKRRSTRQRDDRFATKEQVSYHAKSRSSWRTKLRSVLALASLPVVLLKDRKCVLCSLSRVENSAFHRFPEYGAKGFAQQCNWTVSHKVHEADCAFLLRPFQRGNEGVGEWISKAASGYISAKQTGCRLLMDYGDAVDINEVLRPVSINWTIPSGFQCTPSTRCTSESISHNTPDEKLRYIETKIRKKTVRVPNYRHAYVGTPFLNPSMFRDLVRELPGFALENGMACSLGSLFDLAPSAMQFQPDLFTRILPTLRDETALVIGIYYRSGFTDVRAIAEKKGRHIEESVALYTKTVMPCLKCALLLEEKHLSRGRESGLTFSRVVWMLVTDSIYIKQWVSEAYGSQRVNHTVSWTTKMKGISREVLTTKSRGTHTRAARNPSTADFAEALIDWYLIGESDVVVTTNRLYSFGATASLRTARPLYEASIRNCSKLPRFAPTPKK